MAINRYESSLTSCDPKDYDNIYQVSKRVDLKSPTVPVKYADTIERCAAKEAMNRLQRPLENTIMQPNSFFKSVGKYIFLGVAMPPYFLLYGLPKWILVEGYHVVNLALTWLTNQLKEKTEKPIKFITQKINMVMLFLQMTAKRLIKPVADLGIQLRQFFQKLTYGIGKSLQQFFEQSKKILKKPQELAERLSHHLQENFKAVRNWVKESALSLNSKIEEGAHWIKEVPQLFLGWGTAQIQQLNNLQASFAEKFGSKFRQSSKAAQTCTEWVSRQMTSIGHLVKKSISPLALVYHKMLKPFMQAINRFFKTSSNKSGQFFNNRKKRMVMVLEEMQKKMKALTPQQAIDKLLPSAFLSRLPAFIRALLLKIKDSSLTLAFFRLGITGVTSVAKVSQAAIEGVSTVYGQFKNQVIAIKDSIVNLSKGTVATIQASGALAGKGCKNGLHGSLVIFFMAGILLKWGFESVGETTSQLINKISFFSRKTKI